MGNASTPTKPFTFAAGQKIKASEANANLDALYTELQGNVGLANLLPASVDLSKLVAAVAAMLVPTGAVSDFIGTVAPSGYVLGSGRTLSNGVGGGTERANADCQPLFELIWNSYANTEAAVSTGRGASATADFNAGKTIVIPDCRGRTRLGKDNMGGATAGNVTVAGGNFDATVQGKTGGAQNQTLSTAQIPVHTHLVTDPTHNHAVTNGGHAHTGFNPAPVAVGGSGGFAAGTSGTGATSTDASNVSLTAALTGISIQNAGSGSSHPNVQPSIVFTVIIKL